jgi:poly(A) polymerase
MRFDFADILFDAFERAGEELFFVGGFVRDWKFAEMDDDLYNSANKLDPAQHPWRLPSHARQEFYFKVLRGEIDVDFATSARPERTMEILKLAGMKSVPIGIEFGTVQTFLGSLKVEITTYRCSESYTKGSRKPSVVFGKTIQEDLARRDFTINAMAMTRDGTIIDPHGGFMDLCEGLLWTPGDVEVSFGDDPLRMMRAARFTARGIASPSWQVGEGVKRLAHRIKDVSSERIFDEMSKLLMSRDPGAGLHFMAEEGLIRHIFPELQIVIDFKQNQGKWHSKKVWEHTIGVVEQSAPILEVRWAALFHDVAKPQTYQETDTGVHFYQHDWKGALAWEGVARRLRVSNEFRDHVYTLIYEHLQPSLLAEQGASDKALRRLAHRLGDKLDNLFHLSIADITSHRPDIVSEKTKNCRALKARIDELLKQQDIVRIKLPSGTGTVLSQALGLKPGPELGKLMKALEQKLIDGELTMESDFVAAAKELTNAS